MHNFWKYFSLALLFPLYPQGDSLGEEFPDEENADFIVAVLPGFIPPPNITDDQDNSDGLNSLHSSGHFGF